MAIVHDGARYMPDLLDYLTEIAPKLTVKSGHLTNPSEIKTLTMEQYSEEVSSSLET
jgi:hypothetical protein